MSLQIEKGIPIPEQTQRPRGRPLVYRWDLMECNQGKGGRADDWREG
jgi:hypothetical protein